MNKEYKMNGDHDINIGKKAEDRIDLDQNGITNKKYYTYIG